MISILLTKNDTVNEIINMLFWYRFSIDLNFYSSICLEDVIIVYILNIKYRALLS